MSSLSADASLSFGYTQDISMSLTPAVDGGVSLSALRSRLERLAPFWQRLKDGQVPACGALLRLVEEREDIDTAEDVLADFKEGMTHLAILGTGGSGLGTAAMASLRGAFGACNGGISCHIFDNLDPFSFEEALTALPLKNTRFLVVSKSGSTLETMTQAALVAQKLSQQGLVVAHHMVAVTEPRDNPLQRFAHRHALKTLPHPLEIGGRFSVLTLVGMVPALLMGLPARQFREGAAWVVSQLMSSQTPGECAPALGAALLMALEEEQGIAAHVCLGYGDKFERFTAWARQLWAESLGKEGKGSLFVPAIGPVDQHSQVQLYRDGPRNKSYTLLFQDLAGKGDRLIDSPDETFQYLAGRTVGDVVEAEQHATKQALLSRGLPVRVFHMPEWNAFSMGALFMHNMLETIFAAELMGVNAYDQPAVEDGKIGARKRLEDMGKTS